MNNEKIARELSRIADLISVSTPEELLSEDLPKWKSMFNRAGFDVTSARVGGSEGFKNSKGHYVVEAKKEYLLPTERNVYERESGVQSPRITIYGVVGAQRKAGESRYAIRIQSHFGGNYEDKATGSLSDAVKTAFTMAKKDFSLGLILNKEFLGKLSRNPRFSDEEKERFIEVSPKANWPKALQDSGDIEMGKSELKKKKLQMTGMVLLEGYAGDMGDDIEDIMYDIPHDSAFSLFIKSLHGKIARKIKLIKGQSDALKKRIQAAKKKRLDSVVGPDKETLSVRDAKDLMKSMADDMRNIKGHKKILDSVTYKY